MIKYKAIPKRINGDYFGFCSLKEEEMFNNINLDCINFTRATLFGVNLTKAKLTNAKLTDTKFHFCNLSEANLTGANLQNTWFWKSNLIDANLTNAKLEYVNLCEAKLTRTNFSGSNIKKAYYKFIRYHGEEPTDNIFVTLKWLQEQGAIWDKNQPAKISE